MGKKDLGFEISKKHKVRVKHDFWIKKILC